MEHIERTAEEWFEDVMSAGGNDKHTETSEFRKVVFNVLTQAADPANAEKVVRINGNPAIQSGKIANGLKKFFVNLEKNQERYNRSYRYLKNMEKTLNKKGWQFVDHDGKSHLALVEPEKFSE